MNEWISIHDKEPLDDAFVLCSGIGYGCRDVFIGYKNIKGDWFDHNNGDYFDGGYGDDHSAIVTHWQPLPAPARSAE